MGEAKQPRGTEPHIVIQSNQPDTTSTIQRICVRILGFGGAIISKIEDGTNNKIGVLIKFGDSSSANVAISSNSIMKNKNSVDPTSSNSVSQGLDLSLKL
ncbi:hypothetical protein MtrunA17_Chr5g0396001 [Medicago truncatula]|uniref:Uncharacterized protein n=1 Tax=Medicago truncatula TaxID=3880 RepID=G7K7U9_MEDTR|nr:hypothetical protein MTR_5g008250 [Medicago truncatula]RHN53451.1 hypothetical protein MtrunA17_Chr5g0396001 [Medicago truncatula]